MVLPEVMNNKIVMRASLCTPRYKHFNYKTMAILWVVAPLFSGILIYLLFRSESIIMFRWLFYLGIETPILFIRQYTLDLTSYVPDWIIYSLPNGLWAFSYSSIICFIWLKNSSLIKYLWLLTIPFMCFGYEALQYLEVITGTFCYQDLLLCFLGMSGGIFTAVIVRRKTQ